MKNLLNKAVLLWCFSTFGYDGFISRLAPENQAYNNSHLWDLSTFAPNFSDFETAGLPEKEGKF